MSKMLIYINDELLDIYEDTEISLVYTPFRFCSDLSEPWTNDFEIPKTPKNLRLLGVTDDAFPVQGYLSKQAITYYGTIIIKSKIEIVSVAPDKISICIFEERWPSRVWTTELWQIRDDDETTIVPWHKNSNFPVYNPGCQYNTDDIQLHPSLSVNEIFTSASQTFDFDFGQPPLSHNSMVVCSQKTVSPKNKKQNLMFLGDSNCSYNKHMGVSGGQHICNDVEGWNGLTNPWEASQTMITFNRKCKWNIKSMIFSYFHDFPNNSLNKLCRVVKNYGKAGEAELLRFFIYRSTISKYTSWENQNISFDMEEDDTISVIPEVNTGEIKGICLTLLTEIQDYAVTDDDYGQELIYCPKNAFTMRTYISQDLEEKPQIVYLNGQSFTTINYHTSLHNYDLITVTPPVEYVSFFGKYTNLPKTAFSKFILNLQRLWNSAVYYNNNDLNPGCVWRGLDQSLEDTLYEPMRRNQNKNLATDKVSYKNIIKDVNGLVFKEWPIPILKNSNNNKEDKVIFESDILYAGSSRVAKWDQYSVDIDRVSEVDGDNYTYGSELKYSFENIDGVMFATLVIPDNSNRQKPYLAPIQRDMVCGQNRMMPVELTIEVPVDVFPNAGAQDVIYISGYKYFVTEIVVEDTYVSISAILTDQDSRKFIELWH